MDFSYREFNDSFLEKIATVSGQAQLQEAGRQYVKTELQESAFSRAIIPQEPITTAECQRNTNDTSLYVLRDIEPDTSAVGVDNLGEPDGSYVKGERYIIPIVNFTTKRFQITVEDLRSYQYKITKRIEEKSVPVLEKLEDKFFMKLSGAAIGAAGATDTKAVKYAGGTADLIIETSDVVKVKNTLTGGVPSVAVDSKKKEVGCILVAQESFEYAVMLPGAGDDFGKDRVQDGLTSDTLFGTKFVKTIKTDIVPQGVLFAYSTPDFLGHNFALGDPNFEIKSNFGLIEWQTKESIGVGIGNRLSVAVLTLKGSKDPDGNDITIATDGTYVANLANFYANLVI